MFILILASMQDLHESVVLNIGSKLEPRDRLKLGMTCSEYWNMFKDTPPTFDGIDRNILNPLTNLSALRKAKQDAQTIIEMIDFPRFFTQGADCFVFSKGKSCIVKEDDYTRYYSTDHDKRLKITMVAEDVWDELFTLNIMIDEMCFYVTDRNDENDIKDLLPVSGVDMRGLYQEVAKHRCLLMDVWDRYEKAMQQINEEFKEVLSGMIAAYPNNYFLMHYNCGHWRGDGCKRFMCSILLESSEDFVDNYDWIEMGVCYGDPLAIGKESRWRFDCINTDGYLVINPDVSNEEAIKIIGFMQRIVPKVVLKMWDNDEWWVDESKPRCNFPEDNITSRMFQGVSKGSPWWEVGTGCLTLK